MSEQDVALCSDGEALKADLLLHKKLADDAVHAARYMAQIAGAAIGDLEWLERHRMRSDNEWSARQTRSRITMIELAQQRVAALKAQA